jgi:uncharacterized RDD family membrane protein YckC
MPFVLSTESAMWTCPSCSAQNTDSAATCHQCATLRKYPVARPDPDSPTYRAPPGPKLNYASVGRRHAASTLDFVPALVILIVAGILMPDWGDGRWDFRVFTPGEDSFLWLPLLLVMRAAGVTLSIQLLGQSPGNLFLGLLVVDESGAPATTRKKMLYELVYPLSPDLWHRQNMWQWKNRRRIWADHWLGTAMIHGDPPDLPDPDSPDDDTYSEDFR